MEKSTKSIFSKYLDEGAKEAKRLAAIQDKTAQVYKESMEAVQAVIVELLKSKGFSKAIEDVSQAIYLKSNPGCVCVFIVDKSSPFLVYFNSAGANERFYYDIGMEKSNLSDGIDRLIFSRPMYESLEESTASEFADGYHVTDHMGKRTHDKPFIDSGAAISHANKKEDQTGRVHTVHHVNGGKVKKQWQFSASAQRYAPYTENVGTKAHHVMHESLEESRGTKGMAKHMPNEYENEWGDREKNPKRRNKAFKNYVRNVRKNKYETED